MEGEKKRRKKPGKSLFPTEIQTTGHAQGDPLPSAHEKNPNPDFFVAPQGNKLTKGRQDDPFNLALTKKKPNP